MMANLGHFFIPTLVVKIHYLETKKIKGITDLNGRVKPLVTFYDFNSILGFESACGKQMFSC